MGKAGEEREMTKAEIIPAKQVAYSTGQELKEWKAALKGELDNFYSRDAIREATVEDKNQLNKAGTSPLPCKVVFSNKKISQILMKERGTSVPYKRKARLCVCGNFESKLYSESDNSTVNADAHVLTAFIAFAGVADRVMSMCDISAAFLNATMKHLVALKPTGILVQLGLVASYDVLWVCKRAMYGLRSAPRDWELAHDEFLKDCSWKVGKHTYHLRQSLSHPSMWVIVEGPHCKEERSMPPLRDGHVIPDVMYPDRATPVGAMIVYVDDLLMCTGREISHGFWSMLQHKWKTFTPELLGNQEGDSESLNFLGLEIEMLLLHCLRDSPLICTLDTDRHRVLMRALERPNIKQLETCSASPLKHRSL
eukprot:4279985-Amphidinium_carterae.2